jgi:hypothetical protein
MKVVKQIATYIQGIFNHFKLQHFYTNCHYYHHTEEYQLKISKKEKLKKYVDVREWGTKKLPNEALLFSTVISYNKTN